MRRHSADAIHQTSAFRFFRKSIPVVLILFAGIQLQGQESRFMLYPAADSLAVSAGLGLFLGSEFLLPYSAGPENTLDKGSINPADRYLTPFELSSGFSTASDILTVAALLSPPLLLISDITNVNKYLVYGTMYAESFFFTGGIKNLLKFAVMRPRPYAYHPGTNDSLLSEKETLQSFPSGHTAYAFQAAGFITAVSFIEDFTPALKWSLSIVSVSLATAAGVSRILAGEHFLTDVLAGGILGAGIGVLVPFLHVKKGDLKIGDNASLNLELSPSLLGVRIKF